MTNHNKYLQNTLLLLMVLFATSLQANRANASGWHTSANVYITGGQYQNSDLRKEALSTNMQISTNYLELWGINFRAGYSDFVFHQASDNIEQSEYGFRFYKNIYSDSANGVFTLLLGNYWISGKKIDTTVAIYPEITYLNYSKTFFLGLGYANSQYGNTKNPQLRVNQLSATLGFALFTPNLWFNLKNTFIIYDEQSKYAAQPALSWFIPKKSRLYPSILTIGGLIGKRSYAVEQETMLIYNIPDEQQYSYFTSAQWNLTDSSHFSLTIGSETYNEDTNNNNYQYNYINGGLSVTW